jgi:PAS domain S-box-containing protein
VIWQTSPFLPALLLTALACAILGVHVWRHRPAPGVGPAVGSFIATAGWNACYAMELSSANYSAQLFWANVQYIFISATPALMITFALIYTGRGALLSRGVVLALLIEPAITVLLAFSSEALPWLRTGGEQLLVDGVVMVSWSYGTYFWLHTIYSYLLMATSTVILVPVIMRSPHLYRLQAGAVVLGVMAPWLANALYVLRYSPFPNLDLTPFSFFFYAVSVGWALTRLQFLDVVPIARDSVIEDLQDAVLVIGLNGRVADANPAAERLLGLSGSELIGLRTADLATQLATALDPSVPLPTEHEVAFGEAPDQHVFELRLDEVHDHRGAPRGRVAVFHDLTERKLAEEERVRSQRLLAAGELAAGIAHNLNNILVGILAPARRLQDGETGELARDTGTIVAAAERARDLVQRLNRGGDAESAIALEGVDVAAVIGEAVEAARPRWEDAAGKRGVAIDLTLEIEQVPPARCDRTGLHDALLNLILNAADAMPEGGNLTIGTCPQDDCIAVRVMDTGTGMDAETVSRVFEPFFTTKVDVGTGLGLSTVYRSVMRWGGDITIDSTPGEGTTFCLLLPVSEGDPVTPEKPDTGPITPTGSARILVAEDEAIVAMVLSDTAQSLGYEVEVFGDGAEALKRLSRGDVDVAVLDLGIPGLSGDEVARQAREHNSRLTTVLMTGWSIEPEDERMRPFDFLLQKPFDGQQSRTVVERAVAMSRLRRPERMEPS